MTVAVTRLDLSARDLRASAARSTDAKAARRMLAIALVMEGSDRAAAARSCGMDRQTLRDWAVLHQSPDKRGVPLPVKMVSQLTQTWHSQVRSFC